MNRRDRPVTVQNMTTATSPHPAGPVACLSCSTRTNLELVIDTRAPGNAGTQPERALCRRCKQDVEGTWE